MKIDESRVNLQRRPQVQSPRLSMRKQTSAATLIGREVVAQKNGPVIGHAAAAVACVPWVLTGAVRSLELANFFAPVAVWGLPGHPPGSLAGPSRFRA